MIVALVRKETRELLPLFTLAALVQLVLLVSAAGWLPKTVNVVGEPTNIPFYNPLTDGDVIFLFLFVGFTFAVLCGLWQTLSELMRGTLHFLLHRPLARARIFGVKLAVGATACLLLTVLPILGYAVWAATPGTHASPFFWSLTGRAWLLCLGVVVIYLATFLSGLRPARWYGSRFWPVALGLFSAYLLHAVPLVWVIPAGALAVLGALYVVAIMHVAYARDFS